jgi:hypothetical protein
MCQMQTFPQKTRRILYIDSNVQNWPNILLHPREERGVEKGKILCHQRD